MADATGGKAPAHLWIVGAVSLLWNGYGAFDHVMSVTRNEAYLAHFPPEIVELLDAFPPWANAAWAVGVWASLAGAMLLLRRSRYAVIAFALSLTGAAISFVFQFSVEMPAALSGPSFKVMPAVILALIAFQLGYSRAMARRGILR